MHIARLLSSVIAVAALAGCAHPIVMSPDIAKIEAPASTQPVKKVVGYYIADDLRAKEVTTPGGGGDKVTYLPYRDIETGFYKMLTNVFGSVVKLKTPQDAEAFSKNNVAYVITPQLTTDSSSPSPFTWPPTKFTVDLTCDITDVRGNPVMSKKVTGQGLAEFSEFKADFSLSARRASADALLKMQQALAEAPELRK